VTGFVREAREADAPSLAQVQVTSWQCVFDGTFTAAQVAALTSPETVAAWAEHWRDSITNPPTTRHRVLVAVTAEGSRDVIGFAHIGPATDEDRWPRTDGQLYGLCVLPSHTRQGHGSRLLHAVASTLADDGFRTATMWVSSLEKAMREFLESSGWAPDGAHADLDLDLDVAVPTVRLHTQIAE
jgi:GNAT superfamily N-acetyltransferase